MVVRVDQVGQVGELLQTRTTAECQVNDEQHQGTLLRPEARHQRAAPRYQPGELIFDHFIGPNTAQQTIAVLRESAHVAVDLIVVEGEFTAVRQVLGLVDEIAAQAARVGLLQSHQIIAVDDVRDAIQIGQTPAVRQQMLPAVRQVMMIARRTDAGLDVIAEQAQPPVGVDGGVGDTRAAGNAPRVLRGSTHN